MVTAMDAWAIQKASRGRLDLGLGTQVRAHIERRFSMPYDRPAKRIKEYVAALRHIWGAFQHERRLSFKGDFYHFDLMSPFFDPGPIDHPRIPIYLAAVNERMFRAAAEVADGIEAHPFSTPAYLREVALPAIARGLARSGRDRSALIVACPVFTLVESSPTFAADAAYVRQQLAFYASTPSYRAVLDHHGWGNVGEELSKLAHVPVHTLIVRIKRSVVRSPFAPATVLPHPVAGLIDYLDEVLDRVGLYGDATRIEQRDVIDLAAVLDA